VVTVVSGVCIKTCGIACNAESVRFGCRVCLASLHICALADDAVSLQSEWHLIRQSLGRFVVGDIESQQCLCFIMPNSSLSPFSVRFVTMFIYKIESFHPPT